MSYCGYMPSVFRSPPSIRPSTISKDFSSETPKLIFFKVHMEPSINWGINICSNGYGPLLKMASMSIYGKITYLFTFSLGAFCRRVLTICQDGFALLNKMPARPIYGKTLKIFFLRTKKGLRLNLGI